MNIRKEKSPMTSVDILKEWKNSNPKVENVMLFVSDSLRWDYLPESVAQRGFTFKTVASSLFTASSFPSMVTGLYPPGHGVYSFHDRLPANIKSLMNLDSYNTSLWNENTWIRYDPPESTPLHRLLRQNKRVPLEKIEPPFIYLEDEKGGHCPYGWSFEDEEYEEWECIRFFRDHSKEGRDKLRERYRKSIDRSVRVFEKRLKVLEERNLTESTLVIFTSDHGELLGEYGGHFGHGEIACPEVVYVPTVFIHPQLPSGINFEGEGIMRHVDLYPTIADIVGIKISSFIDGMDILKVDQLPRFGYNYFETNFSKKWMKKTIENRHKEISIWDRDGGYLFRETNLLLRLLLSIYSTTFGNGIVSNYLRGNLKRRHFLLIKDYIQLLKYYVRPRIRYGSPGFDRGDARILIQKIGDGEKERIKIKRSIGRLKEKRKI